MEPFDWNTVTSVNIRPQPSAHMVEYYSYTLHTVYSLVSGTHTHPCLLDLSSQVLISLCGVRSTNIISPLECEFTVPSSARKHICKHS